MSETNKHEEDILSFWQKNKIYEKSKKKNSKGKKFYFMDGPPYANGHIHMGTALNKTLKDIAMRAKRLQGYDVYDRPGYDTHGVPIEAKVEKEIGAVTKKDIQNYGIEKFVKKCKEFATKYIGVMNSEFKNMGIWMDWNNYYLTLDDRYMESIWSVFKEADKKGLLYLGKYPIHICTRCGTAVAFNEIEYGKQKDNSIYVKFKLKDKKDTYLIIWTTTPWTLPGNTGVMVHPEIDYQEIELNSGERWIIAKELVPSIMGKIGFGFTVKSEFKGKKMENWEYENPLSDKIALKVKNGYKVVLSARYVTVEDGTGLVHCAPGHGKEDYEVGKEYGLDNPSPVGLDGLLTEEAGKYAGKKAREVDAEIISDLENSGDLVYKLVYEHDYPLCWRDKTPLLMVSLPQWFLKISKIKKKIISENEKIKWVPDYMKLRMNAWLEGIGDWPVSRQRYWGTPLPIWWDSESGEKIVVGSLEELKKLSGKKNIEMHKPWIDKIEIKSPKTGKMLKRVPEVMDVWFDAGVSSWAALGYPHDNKLLKRYWPADLNIEGRDQFRGWWNAQMILSEILFGKNPVEAIEVHGMVLDLGKKKMSKSLGNVTAPADIIEQFGRDFMRYFFAKLSKGEDFSYDEKEFDEIKKFMMTFSNINNYANQLEETSIKVLKAEDKWIMSKFNKFLEEVAESYNSYKFTEVVQKIEEFVVKNLSRTYIQLTRERANETYQIINHILIGILKTLSPIMPFITEKIWQEIKQKKMVKEESIHLSVFPYADKKVMDAKLEKDFESVLKIIELGLAERDKEKIGLRWPLSKAVVCCNDKIRDELKEIICRQLNVKSVLVEKSKEGNMKVKLDTKITEELETEGFVRELSRKIQSERKNAGFKKGQTVNVKIYLEEDMNVRLKEFSAVLSEKINASNIEFSDVKKANSEKVFTIKERKFAVNFS